MLPLPKGARADLFNSDMYRSIAISSLLSKILDNVIIERQQDFLSTSNYQFGFKAKSSTVLCTTMVNETIQYYTEKGGRAVYLLLLDASKAFDKASYEKLFELLLARNECPKIVKLLYYMYTHQKCLVRWNNKQSDPFSVSNGVKQGSVISPLLRSIYIYNLFSKLKQLGLGCHVGLTYDIKCSLFQTNCTNMYYCQLWCNSTKGSINKLSTSYNSVLRRLLCISKPYSASNMFVSRGIP